MMFNSLPSQLPDDTKRPLKRGSHLGELPSMLCDCNKFLYPFLASAVQKYRCKILPEQTGKNLLFQCFFGNGVTDCHTVHADDRPELMLSVHHDAWKQTGKQSFINMPGGDRGLAAVAGRVLQGAS